MQTVVRGGPRDVIALAWFRLGYRPRESLVLVGLNLPGWVSGLVARVSLPPVELTGAALDAMVTPLRRSDAGGVVVLVVSDDAATGWERRARTMRSRLRRAGLEVLDVLLVGSTSYRSLLCTNESCCPPAGHCLDEVWSSEVAAVAVSQGRVVLDAEHDLVADIRPDPAPACLGGPSRGTAWWFRRWSGALDAHAAGAQTEQLAREWVEAGLTHALRDGHLRDAVMLRAVPGAGREALSCVRGEVPDLDRALTATPDRELLQRARALLAAVARVAPEGERADVLAVLAWLAWWGGDAARARLLVQAALGDRDGHTLAGLVDDLLLHAVPPPWVGPAPRTGGGRVARAGRAGRSLRSGRRPPEGTPSES